MAAQLILMKGCSLRALCRWMARAISSLPVPVSPVMSTVVVADLGHAAALPDDPVGIGIAGRRREVAVAELPGLDRLQDDRLQIILFEGFGEVIEGPLLQGVHGVRHGAVGGEDDDGQGGIVLRDPVEETHAVEPRHLEVRGDGSDLLLPEDLQGLQAVRGRDHLITLLFQHGFEDQPHVQLVVHNEDLRRLHAGAVLFLPFPRDFHSLPSLTYLESSGQL